MPIYEYRCPQCEHAFELLVKSAAQGSQSSCPSCGSQKIVQRLSVIAAGPRTADVPVPAAGGCGRCGDPNGPCSL